MSVERAAVAQLPVGAFRIMDKDHTQMARVNHVGQLSVDASVTIESVAHISGALHIAGSINGARIHIQGLGTPGSAHGGALTVQGVTGMIPLATAAGQSGTWTVQASHQGGQWNVNHVTSVTHVAVVSHVAVTSPYHSEAGLGAFCHTTLAVHVSASGFTQLIHLTSSNGGVDQSVWYVYFCSVLLTSSHAANSIALIEGVGTTCQTGLRPLIGAIRVDETMHTQAGGGFSMVSPSPFLSTQRPGNNVCLGQSSRGTSPVVSGTISYRAGPASRR